MKSQKMTKKNSKKSFFCWLKRFLIIVFLIFLVGLIFFARDNLSYLRSLNGSLNVDVANISSLKSQQAVNLDIKTVKNDDSLVSPNSQEQKITDKKLPEKHILGGYLLENKIANLEHKINELEVKIDLQNLNKTIPSLLVSYVKLERKINLGHVFDNELRHMQILSKNDLFLTNKLIELENFTHLVKSNAQIEQDFEDLILTLAASENPPQNLSMIDKIKYLFLSNVSIRQVKIKPNSPIKKRDYLLIKAQKAAKIGDFEQLFDILVDFKPTKNRELQAVLSDIAIILEVRKISSEIFSYLNELT
jgi:hypothetical protein